MVWDIYWNWYTDPEKFQGEVNLKVIKFIDEITNFPDRDGESGEQIDHLFLPVTVTTLPVC